MRLNRSWSKKCFSKIRCKEREVYYKGGSIKGFSKLATLG